MASAVLFFSKIRCDNRSVPRRLRCGARQTPRRSTERLSSAEATADRIEHAKRCPNRKKWCEKCGLAVATYADRAP